MIILALEFSSNRRAVAVYETAPARVLAALEEEFGAKTAMQSIDEALRSAGIEPKDVGRIAIGLGPGSNAGIRSALSIAQGWHLARGVPIVGLPKAEAPSAEALARLAAERAPSPPENLEPIYEREVAFVKAPAPRVY